jgi:uncharacterized Zn-binding protein involved in type VI secretion
MRQVIRLGTDPSTGHGCWPSRPTDSSNTSVYVNGILANTVTDHYPVHCCKKCHDGFASSGSSTVFIERKAVHRNGDAISCGDTASNGSTNVLCGG